MYSSAYLVRHAIADDFKVFLDRSLYYHHDAGQRSECSGQGTGHKTYACMQLCAHKNVVWPHHDLLHTNGEDYASFARAVERFRRVCQTSKRPLFLITQPIKTKKDLAAVREEASTSQIASKTPPMLERGGASLGSIAQLNHLFADLQKYVQKSSRTKHFHLDAIYLVAPEASETKLHPRRRLLLSCRKGFATLRIYELHCVGANTGLYFKSEKDHREFRKLLFHGRKFEIDSIDSSWTQGYSDNLKRQSLGKEASAKSRTKATAMVDASAGVAAETDTWRIRIRRDNPKLKGTAAYERFEAYKKAKTVKEFLRLGGCHGDLTFDMSRGWANYL